MEKTIQENPFRPNDFDLVYYSYFSTIWDSGDVYANPSGWHDTEAKSASLLPPIRINNKALGKYYLDEADTLGDLKQQIMRLLEFWEQHSLTKDQITLYNSVSTANAAVLLALRTCGVKTVIFESPAYGVTVNQAREARYNIILVPTYHEHNFKADICFHLKQAPKPVVVWLTQPRMSLGFDQEPGAVAALLAELSPSDFLVIDEATEQKCPSVLSHLLDNPRNRQVLRVRGLVKPLGLNGLRISCVLHSAELRDSLESTQEIIGASLDLYSLQAAAELAQNHELFVSMLSVANAQVTGLRKRAEALASGSSLKIARLVNGYMGTALVPFRGGSTQYTQNRYSLLNHCRSRKMPVILGASMFFAFDPSWEQIRFNYFSREHHILRAVEVLCDFVAGVRE